VLFVLAASVVGGITGAFFGKPHIGAQIGDVSAAILTRLPSFAVAVRRLHDIGRSGWIYLLACVPFVGIVLLLWYFMDSRPANRWGPNPKASEVPPAPLTLAYGG
jgi:uncharacterized membrane protein YhaH (DUF805 family)